MEYFKINSLYKRGEPNNQLIFGDYSKSEFGNVRYWSVDEKIDGMNIRLDLSKKCGAVHHDIKGRTDAAIIPPGLKDYFVKILTSEKLFNAFEGEEIEATLYGEGYGPKIQNGGWYSKDYGFVLFDVRIGKWWMARSSVEEIARRLQIPVVPNFGKMQEEEVINLVRENTLSLFAQVERKPFEGVVCRPDPLMLFRDGSPVVFKLKCRDFFHPKK